MKVSDLKIHHIGVAVVSIDAAVETYAKNGYLAGKKVFDPLQDVNICFLEKPNELLVELLEPASENSPVSEILAKGEGEPQVYHVCYAVSDIDKAIADLRKESWLLVKSPLPAVACGNARVAFLFSKEAGLVELLEQKP